MKLNSLSHWLSRQFGRERERKVNAGGHASAGQKVAIPHNPLTDWNSPESAQKVM